MPLEIQRVHLGIALPYRSHRRNRKVVKLQGIIIYELQLIQAK